MKTVSHLQRLLKAITFLLFSVFTANAVAGTSYEFISRSTDGLYTGYGQRPQVTPDGRFVVYVSSDSGLVTPNAPGYQIYLFDRTTHATELISVSNAGAYGNNSSDHPTVSDDGCRVVFQSFSTNLVSGAGSAEDVFVRDRCTNPKQTRVVSADVNGIPGWVYNINTHAQSFEARISGDGRYVAFVTYANNINGSSASCGTCDVTVRKNLDTGAIDVVSVNASGTLKSGLTPDISYDGSRIVFWAYSFDGASGWWDIYLWDATLSGQRVSRVSTGSNGATQINPIGCTSCLHSPGISGNGRFVAFNTGFVTGSPSLTAEGGNGYYQIYVKDTQTGTLTLASVSPSGALGDRDGSGTNGFERPALSYDGRYVAFISTANNLVTSSVYANSTKPLVRDLVANQTILVADRAVAGYALGYSSNGRFAAFTSNQTTLDPNFPNTQGVYLADLTPLSKDIRSYVPSANAGYGYTSYLRLINTSATATPVTVAVIDGTTGAAGAAGQLSASLPAGAAVTYTAQQIEAALGGALPTGDRPRIRVSSNVPIEVQSFMSNPGGIFTQIADAMAMPGGGLSHIVYSYVPAAVSSAGYTSYIRVINVGSTPTAIQATIIDGNTGIPGATGQLTSSLAAGAATTFTAQQIETAMGVALPAGDRPRLQISGVQGNNSLSAKLEVQSFMANPGGVFTMISGVQTGTSVPVRSYVPAANSAAGYTSYIRVINNSTLATAINISVIDGNTGLTGASGQLAANLPAGAAVTYTAQQIETALGMSLPAGDRPRILVSSPSSASLSVQSFMSNPGGIFTQISGSQSGNPVDVRTYVPAATAAHGYTSYLRIINTGATATPVSVAVIDGTTGVLGVSGQLAASLPAGAAVTYTAQQIETALGISLPAGDRPRIRITANGSIDVQSFMLNPGGVFTETVDFQ